MTLQTTQIQQLITLQDMLDTSLSKRLNAMVMFAWQLFGRKIGSKLIVINKEASMQLNFSYILKELIPLITFSEYEKINIELETTRVVDGKSREIDILITGKDTSNYQYPQTHTIAIELKCYKFLASSGNSRGAHDVFMKDVYVDLFLLEKYKKNKYADECFGLVMTDYHLSIKAKDKSAKCWDYDINDGHIVKAGTRYTTQIGSKKKQIDFTLEQNYQFNWQKCGDFWLTALKAY